MISLTIAGRVRSAICYAEDIGHDEGGCLGARRCRESATLASLRVDGLDQPGGAIATCTMVFFRANHDDVG